MVVTEGLVPEVILDPMGSADETAEDSKVSDGEDEGGTPEVDTEFVTPDGLLRVGVPLEGPLELQTVA